MDKFKTVVDRVITDRDGNDLFTGDNPATVTVGNSQDYSGELTEIKNQLNDVKTELAKLSKLNVLDDMLVELKKFNEANDPEPDPEPEV